ncbi:hypothetical protein LX32DRAFT_38120 [Colletotrichum zoysiae]|uniref:Uncharacterized protein n=1 Tax=Colletotrichum zoysiae TaxID=1216348 RepID=A0AAD9HDK4_9PEZI|nr:hypothetical protein LX32DRAFT_38120 [Colletotrichum zoysiae]
MGFRVSPTLPHCVCLWWGLGRDPEMRQQAAVASRATGHRSGAPPSSGEPPERLALQLVGTRIPHARPHEDRGARGDGPLRRPNTIGAASVSCRVDSGTGRGRPRFFCPAPRLRCVHRADLASPCPLLALPVCFVLFAAPSARTASDAMVWRGESEARMVTREP